MNTLEVDMVTFAHVTDMICFEKAIVWLDWVYEKYVDQACITSAPPSAAYMRQWTGSSLVQIMACRLFGVKPLPEPMLPYCELDPWEPISVKFEHHFHSIRCIWKFRLPNWQPFCPGGGGGGGGGGGIKLTLRASVCGCLKRRGSNP